VSELNELGKYFYGIGIFVSFLAFLWDDIDAAHFKSLFFLVVSRISHHKTSGFWV
jgi:hypothetical protein